MLFNDRLKSALKTALAMVLAYGLALSFGWDKPMWAGFAVAFISLSTTGLTVNKGLLRFLGTMSGILCSLLILMLLTNNRWQLITGLSLIVGFCTYMSGGANRQYFWRVTGFVTTIITFYSIAYDLSDIKTFNLAVLRVQETVLGIVTYTTVTVILWPKSSYRELQTETRHLVAAQNRLQAAYYRLLTQPIPTSDIEALRKAELDSLNRFGELLEGATSDSYPVMEKKRQWRCFHQLSRELHRQLEGWRECIAIADTQHLLAIIPNLPDFEQSLTQLSENRAAIWENSKTIHIPSFILPTFSDQQIPKTDNKRQLIGDYLLYNRIRDTSTLTRQLLLLSMDIMNRKTTDCHPLQAIRKSNVLSLDYYRLAAACRVMVIMWIVFVLWINIRIPGDTAFLMITTIFGCVFTYRMDIPVKRLYWPMAKAALIASSCYLLIMPMLSSFLGLGIMLFCTSFYTSYCYSKPDQILNRVFSLLMLASITSISNVQTYDVIHPLNITLMFAVIITLLSVIIAFCPTSKPKTLSLWLIRLYFRQVRFVFRWMGKTPQGWSGWVNYRAEQFCSGGDWLLTSHRLTPLLQKLQTQHDTSKVNDHLRELIYALESMSYRLDMLIQCTDDTRTRQLLDQRPVSEWLETLRALFDTWIRSPETADRQALTGVEAILAGSEDRLFQNVESAMTLSTEDDEALYSFIGYYKNFCLAVSHFATAMESLRAQVFLNEPIFNKEPSHEQRTP
ncbi:FUSC family protein [Kistimonas asteriae]|uniref:FUSC family protein n=1 Tax=Kistimonas asteriae TaxID=517724 RepID=UPI001BAD1FB0|nr:FUSC family protein [Kistimonas asteriae]